MKKNFIPKRVSRDFYKAQFTLKKYSPEILLAAGIVGIVTSTVLACKATFKVNDILSETKETIEKIHNCAGDEQYADRYSKEDARKDLTIAYIQTGVKLTKLYAPALIVGSLSLSSIIVSSNIQRSRNVALAAAYAAVDKSYSNYRQRVVERFGERVDYELRYNIRSEEFEETVIDANGKPVSIKKTSDVIEPAREYSEYMRIFDETNPNWEKDSDYNVMFLRAQQAHANDLLQIRGVLFLNDVYEMLGFPITKAGQVIGWVYDEKNPVGENFVDFGIYDIQKPRVRDFINGYEPALILDFNVDGNVWEMM